MLGKIVRIVIGTDNSHARSKLTAITNDDSIDALDVASRHVTRIASPAARDLLPRNHARCKVNGPWNTVIYAKNMLPQPVLHMGAQIHVRWCS